MPSYAYRPFPSRRPTELDDGPGPRRPVAIVGAGPVGLAMAIDLAIRGVPSVVLDDNDVVSVGSRAICWAKRTLEIFDRLGIGDRMLAKGVTWKIGRFYRGAEEIHAVDLLPEEGHKMPAFINLQQYYVEEYLVERAADFPGLIDLRWKNRAVSLAQDADGAVLQVETPHGAYPLAAEWVVAADGARSAIRSMLGVAFTGKLFEEKFLIADVQVKADMPNERRFWFRPPFDPGESVLVHRQPDDVYRIDFQLGPEADAEREKEPERVLARVRRVLGDVPVALEWCSVYSFRCARAERFRHGRVLLVGDSAHVVSPFGARGGNGGIQDVDNLAWKLALVLRGEAPASLIGTYDEERGRGADDNILQSSRTSGFMTPRSAAERAFRDGVLALASRHAFARALVNGGRLSRPCSLAGLSLQTRDGGTVAGAMEPGTACLDAPVRDAAGRDAWLLGSLGDGFTAMVFCAGDPDLPAGLAALPGAIRPLVVAPAPLGRPDVPHLVDPTGLASARYGGVPGVTYLVRPDQHVAARFAAFDPPALAAAHALATGQAAREAA